MPNRYWIQVLPLAILFALQATTSHTQEAIGKATSVRPQAEAARAGRARFQEVPTFIRRRQSVPVIRVRRICNFATKAI